MSKRRGFTVGLNYIRIDPIKNFQLEEITRMASPNAIKMPSSASSSNSLSLVDRKNGHVEDSFSGLDIGVSYPTLTLVYSASIDL